MKSVRRLTSEPAPLARYRAEHPDDATAPAEQARQVWDRFRNDSAYREFLDALREAQQGLCIYCEQRLVDGAGVFVALDRQVEHVEPKAGAAAMALEWTNLALACCGGTYRHEQDESRGTSNNTDRSCGQHKGESSLRPNCDPRHFPPGARLFDLFLDGTLAPNIGACNRYGVPYANLDATLNAILNLNCERLRVARQKIADNVRGWLIPLSEQLLDDANLAAEQRRQILDLLIAGRLQPDAGGHLRRFWTAERCMLGAPADQWVEDNLTLFD